MNSIGLVEYKKRGEFLKFLIGKPLVRTRLLKKKKKKRTDVHGNCYHVTEIIKNINVSLNKVADFYNYTTH